MDTENKPIEVKGEIVNQDSPTVKPDHKAQEPETSVTEPKIRKQRNPKSLANLKPAWPKGVSGNSMGKKGPQVKAAIERQLSKRQQADEIAKALIDGAKKGEDKKIDMVLKVEGAYSDQPNINIQNNTLNITDEILALARKMLIEERKQINES